MKKILLIVALLLSFIVSSVYSESQEITVHFSTKNVKQGHSLSIYLASKKPLMECKAFLPDRIISFFNVYQNKVFRAIYGIDVAEPPGNRRLFIQAKTASGKIIKQYANYQIVEHVFRQTTTDGRTFQAAVVFTPQMIAILKDRKRLAEEARYLHGILKTETPVQQWTGNFIYPVEWLTYREKRVNGKIVREPRETPIFGAKRVNITRTGSRVSYHRGTDYVNYTWTKVHAVASGKIITARFLKARGYTVVIDHGHGILSLYCHLHKLKVRENQTVNKGDFIAYMGSTGLSTGSHLHFELRAQNVSVTPHEWYAFTFYFPLFY